MVEDVQLTPYGAPASTMLAEAIAGAKGQDPLAPVTVVVASNLAGLAARRLLGAGPRGVANVHFLTAFRLAELLAADRLLDLRPLTNPVLGAAVRRTLSEDPGPFRTVRDHVATETALASLYADLSNVGPAALNRVGTEGGRAGATAARLHRSIAGRLTGFHDEAALARAAGDRPDLAETLRPFGPIVWHLPAPLTAPLTSFMRAVLAAAPSRVLVGTTGDPSADARVAELCRRAGVALPEPPEASPRPHADRIVSVTDADEEVRVVVRSILDLVHDGVRLDRIGVFHPTPNPYVRLLEQHLAAAELPANGPSRRRVADTVAGRTLLAALRLPAQRWRRDRVLAVVSGGPLRHGGRAVRPPTWERLSRDAGVVQGLSDWRRKLDVRRRALEVARDEARTATPADPRADRRLSRVERDLDEVDALRSFVDSTAEAIDRFDTAKGWQAKADEATALLRSLLGPGNAHTGWPVHEQSAFDRVEEVLSRLATLDEIDPNPSRTEFVRALTSELDVPAGRNGTYGHGVVYGPLASAPGQDLDAVFVLGCAEGLSPTRRGEDPLLPDPVRGLTDGELSLRADQLHEQHRRFLAALASAPQGRRTLTFPRGSLRSGRESLPSRWLLDTATALRGSGTVHSTDFDDLELDQLEVVPSHVHGLASASRHASLQDRDLVAVAGFLGAGGAPTDHPATAAVRRGLIAQAARRSHRLTEWDGNLAGQPISSTSDRPLSPTRLETWSRCGFRYFLAHVLELADRDDPERVLDLSPLDRGSGVHEALEVFLDEVISAGAPEPDEPWSADQRARLRLIAEDVLDDFERRGRAGRDVHWRLTRTDVLGLLDEFLSADEVHRASGMLRPQRVELPFGMGDVRPVTLHLPDGRELAFRGRADRVDVGEAGRVSVSDYKTGKGSGYAGLADDPFQAGTTLQLGMYAEAARQLLGAEQVETAYWMVSAEAGFARHGYEWTDELRKRFLTVVAAIADGIESGMFAAAPGQWDSWRRTNENCTYCQFDEVCPKDRGEHAEAKAGAPELALRRPLLEPADAEADR